MNEWMVRWSRSQPAAHTEEEGWKDGELLTETQLDVLLICFSYVIYDQ